MDDAKGIYVITDECVDCGACEDGCPVNAIKAE
jgi:NAD-dependent dihydropyrimidine dehydrogenase PreA subunit